MYLLLLWLFCFEGKQQPPKRADARAPSGDGVDVHPRGKCSHVQFGVKRGNPQADEREIGQKQDFDEQRKSDSLRIDAALFRVRHVKNI